MMVTTRRLAMLAAALFAVCATDANAQYGSVRRKSRPKVQRRVASAPMDQYASEERLDRAIGRISYEDATGASYGEPSYENGTFDDSYDGSNDDGGCGDGCSSCGTDGEFLGDGWGCTTAGFCPVITSGIELTFLQPYFESNPAATELTSDGDTFETFNDIEFQFDTEFAPRVWLDFSPNGQTGLRLVWWEFDHSASPVSISPADNGFGRIRHPDFGAVDLSTTVPNSTFNAATELYATTFDFEGTRMFDNGCWKWLAAAGIRYAEMRQNYVADLTIATNNQQGTINFVHESEGAGPTVYLRAQRPVLAGMSLFGSARGSLLFGDSTSELNAVEDIDLDDQLTTRRLTSRDDLMPIGEIQVGLQARSPCSGIWQPYFHVALEAQYWGGVGNASSEDGSLGFFGGNVAIGVNW